ncbi:membrane-spanning 4-domains subfamily A member 12-like [Phacochoerus africanus]|uniref:membrane-spanning 4-domains subfamily A member 12-like n=1 Tax=Phacochoerus africanus TaxID=41426 RepID=UPI001FD97975|nr:membrane-spanning 4-domains subfamily A member 12-like [Phacochoerus africanus]
MARRYPLRKEARALGAVQIILALIHCALGILCDRLFLKEENIQNTGFIPVLVILGYIFWSSLFFIISGSVTMGAQKKPIRYKLISAIVMNILSACFSAIGALILLIACFTYSSEKDEYVWSHLAGSMILQYLLFSAITELITVSITLSWIVKALYHPETSEEKLSVAFNIMSA